MFGLFRCNAQSQFDAKVEHVSISIGGEKRVGYKTVFDFSREEVRHGWWKYAKKFGRPINMKSHYKVVVPSSETDGNVDIEIIAQTDETPKGSIFFLGLENKEYEEQVKKILIDFKKELYLKGALEKIQKNQKKAKVLSKAFSSSLSREEKSTLLDKLFSVEQKIETLKIKIKAIIQLPR